MEKWLEWCSIKSPDYATKKLDIWKVLGSCIINTASKVIASNIDPVSTGNMLIALTGPPGSIKSWAITMMQIVTKDFNLPMGTPEAIAEVVDKHGYGVMYETEIGTVLKQAEKPGQYMRSWGDLLNKIYSLDPIELARRKKSKTVVLPPKSYYISAVIGGTERDFAGMYSNWQAMKRRLLILDMKEVAGRKIWVKSSRGAEVLADLHLTLRGLRDKAFMVALNEEAVKLVNDFFEAVPSVGDPLLDRLVFDYTLKILYATLVDWALSDCSNCRVAARVEVVKVSRDGGGLPDEDPYIMRQVTATQAEFGEMFERCGVKELSLLSPTVATLKATLRTVADLVIRLVRHSATVLSMFEAPSSSNEYLKFIGDVNDMLRSREYVTLREICNKRHWLSKTAWNYLMSMSEEGQVVVRKVGRTTVVLKPTARLCGTCALYGEGCPNSDPKTGIYPDPRDEPCELYRPVGEA